MKKVLSITLSLAICFIVSCSNFDDSEIWDKLNDHENRIVYLEEICKKLNLDIINIQSIITALETNDYIVSASPLVDGSGYTFIFKSGKSIVIYNGKDGVDGIDGTIPTISVMKDVDGIYYWTINGEWLLVNGNKVKASATDGITPQFKIENDYWYVSYDNGNSWEILGKATGNNGLNGTDGDAMFKSVYIKDGYVCFELNDETSTIIRIPLMKEGNLLITSEKEGTIAKLISSEEMRTTTELTIIGPINNKDIQHIQIMNSLQKLDLSNATYLKNNLSFKLNPYQDTLINRTIEELILPPLKDTYIDFSYCFALRHVVVTSDNASLCNYKYEYYEDDGWGFWTQDTILFCPNMKYLEFAEGVIEPSNSNGWNSTHILEKIVYPSTLVYIPYTITLTSQSIRDKDASSTYKYVDVYTLPCDTLICKATNPPVLNPERFGRPLYYDTDSKCYYYESKEYSRVTKYYKEINVPSTSVLYVPKESIELYKNAPLWENFNNIRAIEELQ